MLFVRKLNGACILRHLLANLSAYQMYDFRAKSIRITYNNHHRLSVEIRIKFDSFFPMCSSILSTSIDSNFYFMFELFKLKFKTRKKIHCGTFFFFKKSLKEKIFGFCGYLNYFFNSVKRFF